MGTSDPARRRPDLDPVAGGGEGATRFVAGRRWKAGEERGRRAREGRAEPTRLLPLPGPSPQPAAATEGGGGRAGRRDAAAGGAGEETLRLRFG